MFSRPTIALIRIVHLIEIMKLTESTVKFLVIGLVIGLVGATIPSVFLIQDRESTIVLLNEQNREQDDLIGEIQTENSGLLIDKGRLETQLESTTDELSVSKEETITVRQEKEQAVSEKEAVERALSDLRRATEDLRSDLLKAQEDLRRVESELGEFKRSLGGLEEKWELWKRHSAIAPSAKSQYSYLGHFPSPGDYAITQPSFFVSFPNPSSCLRFATFLGTSSMKPAFNAGHELIENTCFSTSEIRPGEIISYRSSSGSSVVAQVFEVRSNGVITKSIAFEDVHSTVVPFSNIIAVVVAIIY